MTTSDEPTGTPINFGLSRDEERVLHAAEQELIRQCAAEAGFEFIPTPYETLERLRSEAIDSALPPFGSDDIAAAENDGYAFTRREDATTDDDPEAPNRAILLSLSPSEQERYTLTITGDINDAVEVTLSNGDVVSTPRNGCISEARQFLFGDLATYIELNSIAINVESRIRAEALNDREFIAAEARWSDCMHEKGRDVNAQSDAVALAASGYDGGDITAARAAEISIAVDDATCAAESGSVEAAEQAMALAAAKVAGDLEGELIAYQEMRMKALEAAREILDAGP